MNEKLSAMTALTGRIFLVAIFLSSGVRKIFNWSQTAGYMESNGMPLVPFFLAGAIALLILGGLSVLLGYRTRFGAIAIIVFLVPATLIFHDFWAVEQDQVRLQTIHFMKNLGLIGGLLILWGSGPGRFSLDARRPNPPRRP